MKSGNAIILCGGPINYLDLPVSTSQSNAMIPVNGKPVIGWIIDDLINKRILNVTVVLRKQDDKLQNFLLRSYSERLELTLAPLNHGGTIVQSLQTGLQRVQNNGIVHIILGDTLIRDSFDGNQNFVYVGEVADIWRWCSVVSDSDGRILKYIEKGEEEGPSNHVIAGYYHLLDGEHLQRCVEQSVELGEGEISHVLNRYSSLYPMYTRAVCEWYDFGHIEKLAEARRCLIQSRNFNSLKVDPVLNTLTKVSKHVEKLRDELNWYLGIPEELKVLTPRIIKYEDNSESIKITQEYYGYPTLAEIYVYGELSVDTWGSILKRLFQIHKIFRLYQGELSIHDIQSMYVDKTMKRLSMLRQQDPEWSLLLDKEEIIFNDCLIKNLNGLADSIIKRGQCLTSNFEVCIVHGDYCFSNILFDINNQIVRLVDPRGNFGRKGIYGDPRYDMAKLRHSVCGLYDYILHDMFELSEVRGEFTCQIYTNDVVTKVSRMFDEFLLEEGYDLSEIRFIEGLFFLSMIPLHSGQKKRQQMMYLTGLKLLNEVFEGTGKSIKGESFANSD